MLVCAHSLMDTESFSFASFDVDSAYAGDLGDTDVGNLDLLTLSERFDEQSVVTATFAPFVHHYKGVVMHGDASQNSRMPNADSPWGCTIQ